VAHVETVTVRNDLAELPAVYAALEAFTSGAGLPESVRRSLLLIVEELFSNTVSYGYPDGDKDEIAVSASLRPKHVELTLANKAIAFDSSVAPKEPDLNEPVEQKGIGGLGLFLVHQLADKVTHKRVGDTNHTTVLLAHKPEEQGE